MITEDSERGILCVSKLLDPGGCRSKTWLVHISKAKSSHEELAEEFSLAANDREFMGIFRGDANRQRVAILLTGRSPAWISQPLGARFRYHLDVL